jgi:hypothetical protein
MLRPFLQFSASVARRFCHEIRALQQRQTHVVAERGRASERHPSPKAPHCRRVLEIHHVPETFSGLASLGRWRRFWETAVLPAHAPESDLRTVEVYLHCSLDMAVGLHRWATSRAVGNRGLAYKEST